jgi:hypothetical protein
MAKGEGIALSFSVHEGRPAVLAECSASIDDAACSKGQRAGPVSRRPSPLPTSVAVADVDKIDRRTDKRRHCVPVKGARSRKDFLLEDGDDVGKDERPAACKFAPVGRRQQVAGEDGAFGPETGERGCVSLVRR